jgi:NADPH-dependent 2,4-dienoyl-CoA reductase/sulfur reductase-like enzyme
MGHLLVVGASLAGLRAVQAARQAGFHGRVSLVGAEQHLPYDRPPLSKAYLDAAAAPDVVFKEERHLREDLGVDLRLGAPATALDVAAREVTVDGRALAYDGLVVATGATARTLPGTSGIAGVHTLRTLDDAIAVRAALDAGARTVVVGAGFIGSEVASGARRRGLPVTVVEAADVPLAHAVGDAMGAAVGRLHDREGTDLRCGVSVTGVESRGGRVAGVRLLDGSAVEADVVVVGIGATPATGWLAGSGLEVADGVVCDDTLAARGAAGVWCAGDVARWHNELFDGVMRVEHWSTAAEQGAAAARNAVAPEAARPFATVPYFWSDWYAHRIQFVGVAAAEEVRVVVGDADADRFVALYRRGDRVVGALTLNAPALVMKYRALIARRATWAEALEFSPARRRAAATR